MIAKILRGAEANRLVTYLFGPGRSNEHTDQHVIASWSGEPGEWQPSARDGSFDTRDLSATLNENLKRGGLLGAKGTVWHCSVSLPAQDGQLTDEQWREVAQRITDAVGLNGDDEGMGGVRWVAVRHGVSVNGNDHIHVVATLADETGRRVNPRRDYVAAGRACRSIEGEWKLTRTAPRASTADRRTTRAESERAAREGLMEPTRVRLERLVREAACTSRNFTEFQERLTEQGVVVTPTRPSDRRPGTYLGATFADPTYTNKAGQPIAYGGSKLAADLSMPKLQARWDTLSAAEQAVTTAEVHLDALGQAEQILNEAAADLAAGRADSAGTLWAAADHLTVTAAVLERDDPHGPLHQAAAEAARAGRELDGRIPASDAVAGSLRLSGVALWAARRQSRPEDRAALQLATATQRLMSAVADYRRTQYRTLARTGAGEESWTRQSQWQAGSRALSELRRLTTATPAGGSTPTGRRSRIATDPNATIRQPHQGGPTL